MRSNDRHTFKGRKQASERRELPGKGELQGREGPQKSGIGGAKQNKAGNRRDKRRLQEQSQELLREINCEPGIATSFESGL